MKRTMLWATVPMILLWTEPSKASVAIRLSLDELVGQAKRISVVKLKSKQSAWGDKQRRIYTTYTFEVQEDLAGSGDKTIQIRQPGGTVGQLSQRTFGFYQFQQATTYLLLLGQQNKQTSRSNPSYYHVIGMTQGVFHSVLENQQQKFTQQLEGLSFPSRKTDPVVITREKMLLKINKVFIQRPTPG